LVEQIFGNFDDFRLYDTTHLQYEEKVYYFKRLFNEKTPLDGDSMNSYAEGIESTLQLFSYNLITGKEKEHPEFFLDEFNDLEDFEQKE